jgi:hypothetical protein
MNGGTAGLLTLAGVVAGWHIGNWLNLRRDRRLWEATRPHGIHNTAPPTIAELAVSPPG